MARKQWYFAYGSNLDLKRYDSRIGRLAKNGYDPDEIVGGEEPATCPVCKNDECDFQEHVRDLVISKENYEIFKKIYTNLSEKQLDEKRKRQKKWYDNQKDKV